MAGSSLTVSLQFVRTKTTVRDGSIRPESKESKFYYTTHCKDEFYLLRYAQVRTLRFFYPTEQQWLVNYPPRNIVTTRLRVYHKIMLSPLVVPKIVCSLLTSHNFDHYANSHSLHRPQGAVVFLAPSLCYAQG